jgi:protein-S-isoprenylcysteine O-methyltransferase Ste14
MLEWAIFAVASAGIVAFSWPSLSRPRSHGFFRFFAFETILGLLLLNVRHWFDDPFSLLQIISWVLLAASPALAIHGFTILPRAGRSEGWFENTTAIVQRGAYRFIRHPLYASLLFLGWGAFLKHPALSPTILVGAATLFLVATGKADEAECLEKFGESYADYMKTTKMFIPYIF